MTYEFVHLLPGANVNVYAGRDYRALYACANGQLDCVRELIAHKVDIHALNDHSQSALSVACQEGHLEVVQALIDAGMCRLIMNNNIEMQFIYSINLSCLHTYII